VNLALTLDRDSTFATLSREERSNDGLPGGLDLDKLDESASLLLDNLNRLDLAELRGNLLDRLDVQRLRAGRSVRRPVGQLKSQLCSRKAAGVELTLTKQTGVVTRMAFW
jgi:hypothetical protein